MFSSQLTDEELFEICEDFYRTYNNSVFYYFYQGDVSEGHEAGQADEEEEEDEDD